jgi:hypothetical protein
MTDLISGSRSSRPIPKPETRNRPSGRDSDRGVGTSQRISKKRIKVALSDSRSVAFAGDRPCDLSDPLAVIAVLSSGSVAHAEPCTAQIAQIEEQISGDNANIYAGPSAPQTISAQLGRQPTPATVQRAEGEAGALAQAALDHVQRVDDASNAAACREALAKLKNLYGLP